MRPRGRQGIGQGSVCSPPAVGSFVQPSAGQSIWFEKWQSAQSPSMPRACSFGAISWST